MKKTILLFLLCIGFTTLQAQNTSNLQLVATASNELQQSNFFENSRMIACNNVLPDFTNSGLSGLGPASQIFPDFGNSTLQSADDFVVPGTSDATICQIDIQGIFFNGGAPTLDDPSISIRMTIYQDNAGLPGTSIFTEDFPGSIAGPNNPSFSLDPTGVPALTAGNTYWLSIQPIMAFIPFGQWAWAAATSTNGNEWVFQDPSSLLGSPCTSWQPGLTNCGIPSEGLDLSMNISFNLLDQPPVITCPADITADSGIGQCGAVVNFAASAEDPEDGNISGSITYSPASGSLFAVGTTTVTASVTDSAGNTVTCDFDVTVNDIEDPTVVCQDLTVELDALGSVTVLATDVVDTSDDNCGVVTTGFVELQTITPGEVPFIYGGGTLQDTPTTFVAAPTVVSDVTVDVAYDGDFSFGTEIFLLEGPDGSVVYTGTPGGADCTTFYTDSFIVPVATWNGWITTFGPNLTFVLQADIDINDFCTQASYQLTANISDLVASIDFDCSNVGVNLVDVFVTDAAGNIGTCIAEITVEDNLAPVIACVGSPAPVTGTTVINPALATVDNSTVSATIDVTDDVEITDLNLDLNISHTWVGDLQITLESPAGTQVLVFDGAVDGCSGDNIFDLYDDESANPLACNGASPDAFPLGDYIPSNALAAFDGESTLGIWTISVEDTAGGDQGTVNSVGLIYESLSASGPGLDVNLDANGMATILASDLILSVDEACGFTVTTVGGTPVVGSLSTLFGSNNGGGTGGTVYFDVTVGAEDITVTDLDTNTEEAGAFTMEVYSLVGSYAGNEGNAGAWTLSAVAAGTGTGVIDTPSNAVLDVPLVLSAGTTYGMALVLDASHSHSYTNGDGTNESFSDANLTIDLGAASNVPFDGAPFSPRVWNGTINYTSGVAASETIDLDCSNLGENQIDVQVTDASGNVTICTATVNVFDVTAPILVCQDVTIELGEDGTAQLDPADLLAVGPDIFDVLVIGSDNQSGTEGFTDFTVNITDAATVSFDWIYTSNDFPGFDSFGYLLNGVYTQLTDPALGNQSGSSSVAVAPGDVFGFRSQTDDNFFGNNETVISNFQPGFEGQFAQANWNLSLTNSDGTANFVLAIPGGPLSFDACGITVLGLDIFEVDCDDIGTPITVTVFASDASGNLAACTSVVTVVDTLGPVIENCPADQTVDPGVDNLLYEVPDYWATGDTTATDNCTDPVTIFTQVPAAGTLLPDGTYTVTLGAEDEYGNVSTCSFELIVESILGNEDNVLGNGINIYPNPTNGQITIANSTSLGLERAMIFDINGRLVQQLDLTNLVGQQNFDVSNLASGVYMVQVQAEGVATVKRLVRK